MRALKLAACLILAMALTGQARADEPATRPAAAGPAQSGPVRRAIRNAVANRPSVQRPTQQEWDDMMAFMQVNSPARARALSSLNLPETENVRLEMMRKWRNYNIVKEQFPKLADTQLQRFRLEDDLFAMMIRGNQDKDDDSAFRQRIHDKVAQLVQIGFQERQLRIEKLQQMLADERQKLDQDQSRENQIIQQRTDRLLARLRNLSTTRPSAATRPSEGSIDSAHSANLPVAADEGSVDSLQDVGRMVSIYRQAQPDPENSDYNPR